MSDKQIAGEYFRVSNCLDQESFRRREAEPTGTVELGSDPGLFAGGTWYTDWREYYDGPGKSPDDPAAVVEGVTGLYLRMDRIDDHLYSDFGPGTPSCTDGCPFLGKLDREKYWGPDDTIRNDPTEAYYHCHLLDRRVWAEYGECEHEDWDPLRRQTIELLEDYVEMLREHVIEPLESHVT